MINQDDQKIASVTRIKCTDDENITGITFACIEVKDLDTSGTYSGKIDLTPGKPDSDGETDLGEISLELELVDDVELLTTDISIFKIRNLIGKTNIDDIEILFRAPDEESLPDLKSGFINIIEEGESDQYLSLIHI